MRERWDRIRKSFDRHVGMVAGAYLIVSLIWIWLSDWVVERMAFNDAELGRWLNSLKGSAFVLTTGAGLYFAISWANARERRIEAEKRLVEDMLTTSQRFVALGTLASTLAHDFNNILTVIRAATELERSERGELYSKPEYLLEIERAVGRASELVHQMGTFMSGTPGARSVGDVGEAIKAVLPFLQQAVGRGIKLEYLAEEGLLPVAFERIQIERALLNLVLNARDALAQTSGKRIVISVSQEKLRNYRTAFHPLEANGDHVRVKVTDNGCGMEREMYGKIFTPFFTTKGAGRGTGLGLTSTLRIMQAHHGWIEVESEAGRGTCFSLYFPAAAAPVTRAAVA